MSTIWLVVPERSQAPAFLVTNSGLWYLVGCFRASAFSFWPKKVGHAHFQSPSCLQRVLCCGVRDGWPFQTSCAFEGLTHGHLFFPADIPLGHGWSWLRAAVSKEACHLMFPSFCLSYIWSQLLHSLKAISNWTLASAISLPVSVFAAFFFFSYLEHCGW